MPQPKSITVMPCFTRSPRITLGLCSRRRMRFGDVHQNGYRGVGTFASLLFSTRPRYHGSIVGKWLLIDVAFSPIDTPTIL